MIERQLEGRTWIAGKAFSMADCAAAPSLFYAVTYVPPLPEHARLSAYIDRLMDHPPVARAVDQARPYFKMFPGRAGLSRRFYDPASEQ
jgi:glutathione S-transferase